MNKFILCVLDRKNKTAVELDINADAADYAAAAAYDADDADAEDYADYAAAAAYYAYYADDTAEYWLGKYFDATGEDREEYEKVIKESRG